jgi:hypothetical protein
MKLVLCLLFSFFCNFAFSQSARNVYVKLVSEDLKTTQYVNVYVEQCKTTHLYQVPLPSSEFVPIYLDCDSISSASLIFDFTNDLSPQKYAKIGYGTFDPGDSVIFDFDKGTKTIVGNVYDTRPAVRRVPITSILK